MQKTNTMRVSVEHIGIQPAPKDPANGLPRAYVNGKLRYEIVGIDAYGNERIVYGTRTQAMRVITLHAFNVPLWQDDDLCACGVAEKPRSPHAETRHGNEHIDHDAVADLHMQKLLDTVELVLREPELSHLDDDVCEAPARDVTDTVAQGAHEIYVRVAKARERKQFWYDTLERLHEARIDALRNSQAFADALTMWNILTSQGYNISNQETRLYCLAQLALLGEA